MVSVLALAGIGVSFAGFTDAISVYGTVETATVEIDWFGAYSGTFVYKIWGFPEGGPQQMPPIVMEGATLEYDLDGEILIYWGFVDLIPTETQVEDWATNNGGNAELFASSYAEAYGPGLYDVKMVYDNIFPCIDFEADFIFHYAGSIPAKINTAEISSTDGFLLKLWDMYQSDPTAGFGIWVEAYRAYPNDVGGYDVAYDEPVDVGYQLHDCNYVYVKLTIHLSQDNSWKGLTGAFEGKIGVIQWTDQCDPQQPNGD